MKINLTERSTSNTQLMQRLSEHEKLGISKDPRLDLRDSKLDCFSLRISRAPKQRGHVRGAWYVQYVSPIDARRCRYKIGSLDTHPTVAEARRVAQAILRDVAEGNDPALQARKNQLLRQDKAFEKAVIKFRETYLKQNRKEWEKTYKQFVRPIPDWWLALPVNQIDSVMVSDVTDSIAVNTPIAANRWLEIAKVFFKWAREKNLTNKETMRDVVDIKAPAKEKSRKRVLSDTEIKSIWWAFNAAGKPFDSLFKIMLIAGTRRGETSRMRWSDIDLDSSIWCVPEEDTKTGVPFRVYLPKMASKIIDALPRTSLYVFDSGRGSNTVSGFEKAKHRVDQASNVFDWVLHDLRRTARTRWSKITNSDVAERMLNHSREGIEAVYDQHNYEDEMRMAWRQWGLVLSEIVGHTSSIVVSIKAAS